MIETDRRDPRGVQLPSSLAAARLAAVGLALLGGCAHQAPPPSKPEAAPSAAMAATLELQHRFAGSYLYAGGDVGRQAVAAAVERAIAGMSFLAKPVARSTLRQRAEIRDSYTLLFDGLGDFELSTPGYPAEFGPLDGAPFPLETKYGDKIQLTQQFVDGVLVQRSKAEDGGGSTEFRLADDGATLIVRRVMESSQLTAPVDFTLTYRRK